MPRRHAPAPSVITLQTIADRAEVSSTTVSLALRNHPKISTATRDRVHKLARQLGYRANPLISAHLSYLRSLRPRYTGQCLAFITNRSLAQLRTDTRTPLRLYFDGARARAAELGYELALFNLSAHGMSGRRLSQILVARGIAGAIIAPLSEGAAVSDVTLDWDAFALAMIEHTFIEPRLHKVCIDEFATIGRLIQRLLDAGFSRLGIAMHKTADDHANHFWLAGYETYQALAAPVHRVPHFITPDWNRDAFLGWFRRHRPDAIITVGIDAVTWLRSGGLRIPEDVSCATLYWKADRPFLSGYYQNHELLAAAAVDVVATQLQRHERGIPRRDETTLIQAEWREGESIRPRSRQAELPIRIWAR